MEPEPLEQPEKERTGPDWGVYFAAGVFLLVIAGFVALALASDDEVEDEYHLYGPWRFERDGPFWKTLYQRGDQVFDIRFRYLPDEVENITVHDGEARLVAPFYLSFDPAMSNESRVQAGLAMLDSGLKLRGVFGETPGLACTTNDTDPDCIGRPAVTCETPDVSVIVFYEAEEPSIRLDGRCIRVKGTGTDIYRAETLMWYRLLGIVR